MAKKKTKPKVNVDQNSIFEDKDLQKEFNQLHQQHKAFLIHYWMDRSNVSAAYRQIYPTATDQAVWNKSRLLAARYSKFTQAYDAQNLKARQFTIDRRHILLSEIAEDVTISTKDRINAIIALAKMEGLIKGESGPESIIVNLLNKAGYDKNAIPQDSIVNSRVG